MYDKLWYISFNFLGGSIQFFQGQYLPSLNINYVAIFKDLEIATTVVLDKDKNLL